MESEKWLAWELELVILCKLQHPGGSPHTREAHSHWPLDESHGSVTGHPPLWAVTAFMWGQKTGLPLAPTLPHKVVPLVHASCPLPSPRDALTLTLTCLHLSENVNNSSWGARRGWEKTTLLPQLRTAHEMLPWVNVILSAWESTCLT